MKFADSKIHTSRLKSILNSICGDVISYYKFIDGATVSKIVLSRNAMQDYWGSPTMYSSSCHSKHRRYLELLEQIGKGTEFHYDTLSELQLLMVLRGL